MSARPGNLTRRQFAAAVAAAPMLRLAGAGAATTQQSEVGTLYDRSIVIDALANPGSMNVSWPPRGPLSHKQRDAIASSGITAINVTVSADTFEATTRNIALWQGEADRYPTLLSIVRRHDDIARAKKDKTLGLMLGFQNTEMLERDLSRLRCLPSARRAHHPAHLQRSQHRRRRLPRTRRRRAERLWPPGGRADERARPCRGPEPLRDAHDGGRHRRVDAGRRSSRTAAVARCIDIRAARRTAS